MVPVGRDGDANDASVLALAEMQRVGAIVIRVGADVWERRCKRCLNGADPESSRLRLVVTVEVRCRCPRHAMRACGVLPLGLPQF